MIDLRAIEQAVFARAPDRVARVLRALEALERSAGFQDAASPASGYGRLAAAAAYLLADRSSSIADDERQKLVLYNTLFANLFAASEFRSAGFALAALYAGRGLPRDAETLDRYLALLGLDAPIELDIDDILALPPPRALLMALNFVAAKPVLTSGGEARRDAVLAQAGALAGAELPATLTALSLISNAWMNCSYSSRPDKHALKPALNAVLANLRGRLGFADTPMAAPRPLKDRPTLVVVAEVIHQDHVQFRYFGQYLRQLRTRFELVLVAPQAQVSASVPELFDRVAPFDSSTNSFLGQVVAIIRGLEPDVIFWPSVGMARWGPLLAGLRLAPIQLTALGHSASTFIPAIDYYLTEEGYIGDPQLFSETLLLLPDASLLFEPSPTIKPPEPIGRETSPPAVRIAVPSNSLKLNPTFLQVLGRVRREARTPVAFHVFPNCTPMEAAALRQAAAQTLGEALIYPRLPARNYLDTLNACDLVLSPFPFGGLHSVVDALGLGLPVVAMEGLEPHSRTDAMILRRVALPEELIAASEDDYVRMAVRLIDDGERRLAIGRLAIAADVRRTLFAAADSPLRSEVVDTVWATYRHHEQIQTAARKTWTTAELAALDG